MPFIVLAIAFFSSAWAAEKTPIEEKISMIEISDQTHVRLQTTLLTPPASGKLPIAILNHGKNIGNARNQSRWQAPYAARYFLSRGYAVIIPMLPGFSKSDGDFIENSCNAERDGLKNAKDIGELINAIKKDERFDANIIVVLGQSYGGFNTLALGSLNIDGIKALINFSGVRHQPKCINSNENQISAIARYAKQTRMPSIWLYGANDKTVPEELSKMMFHAYQSEGADARLKLYGKFSDDAHAFLNSPQAYQVWSPILDEFLSARKLPTKVIYKDLTPLEYPNASSYAKIDDLEAVPLNSASSKNDYLEFLKKPLPRVAVISQDGHLYYASMGYDPLERAIKNCQKSHPGCEPYAVDNEVVWKAELKSDRNK